VRSTSGTRIEEYGFGDLANRQRTYVKFIQILDELDTNVAYHWQGGVGDWTDIYQSTFL
jgi:hypothetical protein